MQKYKLLFKKILASAIVISIVSSTYSFAFASEKLEAITAGSNFQTQVVLNTTNASSASMGDTTLKLQPVNNCNHIQLSATAIPKSKIGSQKLLSTKTEAENPITISVQTPYAYNPETVYNNTYTTNTIIIWKFNITHALGEAVTLSVSGAKSVGDVTDQDGNLVGFWTQHNAGTNKVTLTATDTDGVSNTWSSNSFSVINLSESNVTAFYSIWPATAATCNYGYGNLPRISGLGYQPSYNVTGIAGNQYNYAAVGAIVNVTVEKLDAYTGQLYPMAQGAGTVDSSGNFSVSIKHNYPDYTGDYVYSTGVRYALLHHYDILKYTVQSGTKTVSFYVYWLVAQY